MGILIRLPLLATLLASIVFVAPRASLAQKRLAVMNIDGTGLRTLSEMPGYAWQGSPSWSRDGKTIAFDATVAGFEQDHIFLIDAAGGEARDIGFGSQPSWSADGKQICFFMAANNPAHEKVGIWVMNADGTSRQFVSPGSQGRWSSDGGQIVYSFRYKGAPNLWVYSILDAESKTLLSDKFASISPPAWSEDGKRIAFVGKRDGENEYRLFTVEADGDNKLTEVAKDEVSFGPPCWAPRDKIVLFNSGATGYVLQLFDPTKSAALAPVECSAANVAEPAWSPDGKQIAFRCDR